MKKACTIFLFLLLLSPLISDSLGQNSVQGGRKNWKGGGDKPLCMRAYNPKTVETISGVVIQVENIKPIPGGNWYWIDLTVKTVKETLSVQLGPLGYFNKIGFEVKPQDRIEVYGSRILFQGKPAILAAGIKRGDKNLKLRNEIGYPEWIGWNRKLPY